MSLRIVAHTIELFDIEERSTGELAHALGARVPPVWPPEHNDQPYRDWQRGLLSRRPDEPDFAGYYIIVDDELVGTCGFKGPPDAGGQVEIGYSVIAPRRRRGHATAAVQLLLERAFADRRVRRVLAETLPHLTASQLVLARTGFLPAGSRLDPEEGEVLRFARNRP